MTRRWITIGAASGAALLAAGMGAWINSRFNAPVHAASAPGADGSLETRVASLQVQLAAERDARLGLAAEVEMLRQLVAEFGAGTHFDTPAADTVARDEAEANPTALDPQDESKNAAKPWFDSQALLTHGVSAPDAARLEALFEESELQLLYLRDQAMREGWADTPRHMQALYEQRSNLRETAGDENFDWLLYATGRTNRVAARSVLATGPAARAGLRSGDLILRYDGRTLFRGSELQRLTSQGEAGRLVPMDVLSKGGQVRSLTVPSGPLGIQLVDVRHPPSSSR